MISNNDGAHHSNSFLAQIMQCPPFQNYGPNSSNPLLSQYRYLIVLFIVFMDQIHCFVCIPLISNIIYSAQQTKINMSEEDSQSHHQQYSQAKLTDSQKETGHPSTSKKGNGTPVKFHRTNPIMQLSSPYVIGKRRSRKKTRSLQQQLLTMKMVRQRYMRSGRYGEAQSMNVAIQKIQKRISKNQLHQLISTQRQEKQSIKFSFQNQLNLFKKNWNTYFQKLNDRVLKIRAFFEKQKRQQRRRSQEVILKKWCSLPHKSIQVMDLQRKEQSYLRGGNLAELSFLKKQKKQIIKEDVMKRQSRLLDWTRVEEQHLRIEQSKRYSTLMSRLNEYRSDKEQLYFRQQKQLRQKYKNVMSHLQHEQKLQLISMNMVSF